jgi:hypothetical protein
VDFKPLDFGFVMECSEKNIRICVMLLSCLINYSCVVWFLLLCPLVLCILHIMCFCFELMKMTGLVW